MEVYAVRMSCWESKSMHQGLLTYKHRVAGGMLPEMIPEHAEHT